MTNHNSELWTPAAIGIPSDIAASIARQGHCVVSVGQDLQHSVRSVFEAARVFFSGSADEKLSNCLPLDSGFRPYGIEYSDLDALPDDVESFTFNPRNDRDGLRSLSPSGHALHAGMARLYDFLVPRLAEVCSILAHSFGAKNVEGIESSLSQWSLLQLNSARAPTDEREFINVAHEDGCLLTAMIGTAPGLEIRAADGNYEAVAPAVDSLLLVAGEILWLMTGGAVPATYHRVRRVRQIHARMSLLLFADLGPPRCRPWVLNEINRDVDVAEKVLENARRYGLQGWQTPAVQARSRS